MNKVLSLALFSLLINFAVLIMITTVPGFQGMNERLGFGTSATLEDQTILDEFGNDINALPGMQSAEQVNTNTLFDRVGLGSITAIGGFLNKYVFGFIEVLKSLFGLYVPEFIFTVMKTLTGLLYAFASIELFTGRRLI